MRETNSLISNPYIGRLETAQQDSALYLQKLLESRGLFRDCVKLEEHTSGVECMGRRDPKRMTEDSYILRIPSPHSSIPSLQDLIHEHADVVFDHEIELTCESCFAEHAVGKRKALAANGWLQEKKY